MILRATIWDVEHGSAAFVSCPNGKTILFDAGSSDSFSPAVALRAAGYGPEKQIDQLVISHPDQDHINDLPRIFEHLKPRIMYRNASIPGRLIYRGPGGTPETEAKQVYKFMNENFINPLVSVDLPTPISNWGGVEQAFFYLDAGVHPQMCSGESCNNYSVVAVVKYGPTAVVFPGDIENDGMEELMAGTNLGAYITSSQFRVLVAPHHGREAGVCRSFLAAIQPSLTVMSDVHGAETTDVETYTYFSEGLKVVSRATGYVSTCRVLTTKMNAYISMEGSTSDLVIRRE